MVRSSPIPALYRWSIVAGLLALFGAVAWSGVREKSNTFDELAHLTAGYSYWLTGDFRLHPENGVLPQRLVALPLLAQNVKFPDTNRPDWWHSDVWQLGHQFFFTLGNDADLMLHSARGMIVLLGMALGAIVYAWSRRLFGPKGATISLVLYVFCPSLLAHSALATSDLTATLAFVVALACFWIVLHRVSPLTVFSSAVAMGFLFVSKMSAVLILPTALLLLAIRLKVGRPMLVAWRGRHAVLDFRRQLAILASVLAVHAIVVIAVIWALFDFQQATFRQAEPNRDEMYGSETIDSLTQGSLLGKAVAIADRCHLLPQPYLHGFAFTVARSQRRSAFLNGEHSVEGWRTFFPYCFIVKTPLATLAILLAAAAAVAARWFGDASDPRRSQTAAEHRWRRGLYRTAPLWVFLFVYWAVAIASHLNIGHRHILPTYPIMFILSGAAGYWFSSGHQVMRWLVIAALVALGLESLVIYPNYLAYFNSLVGGPRHGYRHLVDSSLDWGQDLPGLRRWLDEERDPSRKDLPVYLSYFGSSDPEYYGLNVRRLPGYMDWRLPDLVPLEPGSYCLSATTLQGVYSSVGGPWTDESEEFYRQMISASQELVAQLQKDPQAYQRLVDDPQAADELARWNQTFTAYNASRVARLCAFLRLREPDDSVGYSILVYDLDERDLQLAQFGTPAEWDDYYREKSRSASAAN